MLLSAPGNTIGGDTSGAGNLVSGNADAIQIILLFGVGQSGGTLVQGNLIGTDATGTEPIGNTGAGILINESGGNIIGGTTAGAPQYHLCQRRRDQFVQPNLHWQSHRG